MLSKAHARNTPLAPARTSPILTNTAGQRQSDRCKQGVTVHDNCEPCPPQRRGIPGTDTRMTIRMVIIGCNTQSRAC